MEINNQVLGATQIIAEAVVKGLDIDKNIICKIISYNEDDNYYVVSNDLIKFIAYPSDDTKYTVGTQVNVFVPQGDYSSKQKKLITGKYSDGDNDIVYTDAYEDLILVCNKQKWSFQEDFSLEGIEFYKDYPTGEIDYIDLEQILYRGEYYNRGLKDYTILKVEYRLITEGVTSPFRIDLQLEEGAIFSFSSSEMPGNPYEYDGKFKCEKVFVLSGEIDFSKENLSFRVSAAAGEDDLEKIEIKSYSISFGYRQSDFEEDEYSFQKLSFKLNGFNNEETYLAYGHVTHLILKNPTTNKYEYVYNAENLPSNKTLVWDMGYCLEKSEADEYSNNFWTWQKKTAEGPLYIILVEEEEPKMPYGNWENYYTNVYWLPRQSGQSISNNVEEPVFEDPSEVTFLTLASIGLKGVVYNGTEKLYQSDLFYWGGAANKIFLTIDDDQYHNGYYLYSLYKIWESSSDSSSKTERYISKLTNLNSKETNRTITLHLADDIQDQVKSITWWSEKDEPVGQYPILPLSFDWSNNSDGINETEAIEDFETNHTDDNDNYYGPGWGGVTNFLNKFYLEGDIHQINYTLHPYCYFDSITYQTICCEVALEKEKYITWITLMFNAKDKTYLSLRKKENYLIANDSETELYDIIDTSNASVVDGASYFVTAAAAGKFIQSGIIYNTTEEKEKEINNGILVSTQLNEEKNSISGTLKVNNALEEVLKNYSILKTSFTATSLYEDSTVNLEGYMSVGWSAGGQNYITSASTDFIFYEDSLGTLAEYENKQYSINLTNNYTWEVFTEADQDQDPPFQKSEDYLKINTNSAAATRYKRTCIIIKNDSGNIVQIQPLFIKPYEEKE